MSDTPKRKRGRPPRFDFTPEWADRIYRRMLAEQRKLTARNGRPPGVEFGRRYKVAIESLMLDADIIQNDAAAAGKRMTHDLRRTGATLMAALGVRPDVIERCLNHAEENRMKRTYQRHSWAPEMAEAWRLLGDRLDLLTRGNDNVVTLPRAA